MRFHLHVVDGNASPSPSSSSATAECSGQTTAAMLLAHMTLRCGHLGDVLVVSASTTPALAVAAARQSPQSSPHSNTGAAAAAAAARRTQLSDADATGSEDAQVLLAASELLRGASADSAAPISLPYMDGARIVPYAFLNSSFAEAEVSLRRAIGVLADTQDSAAPYFDLVAATDLATFDYIVEYYQQQRLRHGGAVTQGRGTKPVGVMHIIADDASRVVLVLQRVVEMMLKRSGWTFSVDAHAAREAEEQEQEALAAQSDDEDDGMVDEEEGGGGGGAGGSPRGGGGGGGAARAATGGHGGSADSWVNHIDEAVHLFAQLFGVDVLVAVV
ncbi:hypothetical protein NESM_000378200 [Novymonas esmeraldas]|uniref:Uncharacterized protein n=1 Tax=Novymonas esmeraldas TaxID=1808958 RepID=A0AAW0EMI3_9TRYP